MRLHDTLSSAAVADGSGCALRASGQPLSYAQLLAAARAFAARLIDAGIARGDRVIVLLDNGAEAVVAIYAISLAGAVFVPVNPQTRAARLRFLLADTEARALVTQRASRALVDEAQSGSLAGPVGCTVLLADAPASIAFAPLTPDPAALARVEARAGATIDADLAALIYTSGSTAEPKGVMLTHLNMLSAARSIAQYLELRRDDVLLCVLPLSFDYGLYQVLLAVLVGACVVVERGCTYTADVVRTIVEQRVTVLPGVPTLFLQLLSSRVFLEADLSRLRVLTNTAAWLTEETIARIRAQLPQARFYSMYGLTECKRVSFLPPEELDRRPRSVGRGMPNQECWLEDEQGRRLPNGSQGELVVRGSHVMRGYWRRPRESAQRLRPGPLPGEYVLRTGDLFRTDEDGWLYFVSRTDDIIKTRGEKVSPREVEEAIASLAGVREVLVRGVPDALCGELIAARIVLEDDDGGTGAGSGAREPCAARLTETDVIRHCRGLLEPHRVPAVVEFVPALPRNENGKLRRRDIA